VAQTGLNKPTAHRLLAALAAEGVVEHDPARSLYFVGVECCALGGAAMRRLGYREVAAGAVARIAQATGDSAFFCLRSGTFSVCVLREEGDYWLQSRVLAPATRRPLGIGAAGLAMLSALNDDEVDECVRANARFLAKKHPQFTRAVLARLVRQTRLRGYAVNEGLVLPGAWGLGAVVRSPDGSVLGAFSIGAVESHLDAARQRKIAPLLQAEASRLEAHLLRLESLGPRVRPLALARGRREVAN
jgi:DNA-binding IclR family transcriptional regulator